MAGSLLFVTQVAPYGDGPAGVHGVLGQAAAGVAQVADARVLLRVRDGELDLDAPAARPPSFGYPLAWCFEEGRGRVFSTSLGHFPAAWESPAYLRHLAGGLGWALRT